MLREMFTLFCKGVPFVLGFLLILLGLVFLAIEVPWVVMGILLFGFFFLVCVLAGMIASDDAW